MKINSQNLNAMMKKSITNETQDVSRLLPPELKELKGLKEVKDDNSPQGEVIKPLSSLNDDVFIALNNNKVPLSNETLKGLYAPLGETKSLGEIKDISELPLFKDEGSKKFLLDA
ncbi:hypothetical protein J6Q66_08240 [bacterium]|nr:hypothetical protein [bacterium]